MSVSNEILSKGMDMAGFQQFLLSTIVPMINANTAALYPEFTQAQTRTNIVSEESLSTMMGKISKYLADEDTHLSAAITSQSGVHGLRFYQGKLEYYDTTVTPNAWTEISTGTTIVPIPTVTVGTYTYDGTAQGPQISNDIDTDHITVTNATKTDAGTYTLTLHLSTANAVWSDLTTSDKTYEYTIDKAPLSGITVSVSGYTYAGTVSTPQVSSNPSGGTVTYYGRSTASGTGIAWSSITNTTLDAGTRYCYAVIGETDNYQSFTTPNASFTIAKADITTASVSILGYTFGGTKATPSITGNISGGTVTYYGRATSGGASTEWSSVTNTTYNAGTR
mgnify:FL=1